jgi:hypothetical protein
MNKSPADKEKRRCPRTLINLPADFRIIDKLNVVLGLVSNVSERGLLIQTFPDMPIGTKITINVFFSKDFEVANFRGMAEVVWKDSYFWDDWEGYQYGLKFIYMSNEDCLKLARLLYGQSNSDTREARDEV